MYEDSDCEYKIVIRNKVDEEDQTFQILIKILEVDELTYCIEFSLIDGDSRLLYEIFANFDDYL